MKIAILATGSNGNCCCIESAGHKYLIDIGISFKSLVGRMEKCQMRVSDIEGIFITHEHYDHVSGLKVLAKKIPLEIYASVGSCNGLNAETKNVLDTQKIKFIKAGDTLKIPGLLVTVIRTHHDALEPVGFVFESAEKKLVYLTDTGFVESIYYPLIMNADAYILESNYDTELLWSSNRPFQLKQRIDGNHGHMSNEASAVLLARLIGDKTKLVVRAHISHDCNYYFNPELIHKAHLKVYNEFGLDISGIKFVNGSRDDVTGVYEI